MARLLAALAASGLVSASTFFALPTGRADAWPPLSTAGPFLRTEIRDMTRSHYAKVWAELYPAHRAIVPEAIYVACERRLPFVALLRGTAVERTRHARVQVVGASSTVPGVAVTLRISVKGYGRDPISFVHTFHLVAVSGRWTWLLSRQRYQLYTTTGCGFKPAV